MIFIVADDIPRELLLHLLGVDSLNVNFLNLVFTQQFIKGFVTQRSLFGLDIELAELHSKGVGHFTFELPKFLVIVDLHNNIGLVRAESHLDGLNLILRVLAHVLFKDMFAIEARDVTLDQL